MREARLQDWKSGGTVQNGVGHAGLRSVVYAITKPRMPYSEPAAPTSRRRFGWWAGRVSGSAFLKLMLVAGSGWVTFACVISVSGESRLLSDVRPNEVQSPAAGAELRPPAASETATGTRTATARS